MSSIYRDRALLLNHTCQAWVKSFVLLNQIRVLVLVPQMSQLRIRDWGQIMSESRSNGRSKAVRRHMYCLTHPRGGSALDGSGQV